MTVQVEERGAAEEGRGRKIRPRLTHNEAVSELRGYGFALEQEYPGRAAVVLTVRCLSCGVRRRMTLSAIRGGMRCTHGSAASLPVTPEQAAAELRRLGYEPEEPYPGRARTPWRVRCLVCGQPRRVALSDARHRKPCRHQEPREIDPAGTVEEMKAAGYEPLTPYPGLARGSWVCACMECGRLRSVSLSAVRGGRRCAHTDGGRSPWGA